MNKALLSLLLVIFLILSSCGNKEDYQGPSTDFGVAEYYKPFLFSKSDTLQLTKSLKYNFNDYAIEKESFIKIKLVDTAQKILSDKNIQFYINEELIKDNQFVLKSTESEKGTLKVGLKLLPDYPDGYTSGFISISNHSLDVVNNNDLNTSSEKRIFKWEANHKLVMNPLKKWLLLIFTAIAIIAIVWLIVLRPIVFTRFGKGSLTIQTPIFKNISLHRSIGLTLSNNSIKQNWRGRIFKGRELNYSNPLFSGPIRFTPHSKNKIRIQLDTAYSIQPFTTTLVKGERQYTITNLRTNDIITITYR